MNADAGPDTHFWDGVLPADSESFLKEVKQCYSCSGTALRALTPVNPVKLLRCSTCGLVFSSPRLSDETLHEIYTDNPGELTRESEKALDDYMQIRYENMKKEMFALTGSATASLLDIGCGWGHFLKQARADFSEVMGIELSKKQSQWAREKLDIHVECINIFDEKMDREFSMISLFEVIEHVTNPREVIEWCFDHLKPGGQLTLSTPNFNSIFRVMLGSHWFYFIPTQHLTYFTVGSLRYLLSRAGFKKFKAVTSGRSLLRERFNNHNQINMSADLRSQWLQSLEIRSQVEAERNTEREAGGILSQSWDRLVWRFFHYASNLGFGDQMRFYALKG